MKLPIGTYTLYNNFENCPFKAYNMYVLKNIPRVDTPEMKWGNDVHKAMELRIDKGTPLPQTMSAAEPLCGTFVALKERGVDVRVEYQLAMTQEGNPCGYWDDVCWFRGKLDCVVFARMETAAMAWTVDWKTGKTREEPLELEMGALLLRANHPELAHTVGEYFWLRDGKSGLRYTLNSHSATFDKLHLLRREMTTYAELGEWPKRKNPLCGWCPVNSCEHNTSHRRR